MDRILFHGRLEWGHIPYGGLEGEFELTIEPAFTTREQHEGKWNDNKHVTGHATPFKSVQFIPAVVVDREL